jgi:natural product precursor
MEKKKISLRGLKEVLSDGELKNVLGGGSGVTLYAYTCPDGTHGYSNSNDPEVHKQFCCLGGHGCN